MVRLLGLNKKKGKKRLSPSARTPELIREKHPMYQYALNEYAQTAPPGTGNDDGKLNTDTSSSWDAYEEAQVAKEDAASTTTTTAARARGTPAPPSKLPGVRTVESSSGDSLKAQPRTPMSSSALPPLDSSNKGSSSATDASSSSTSAYSSTNQQPVSFFRSPFEAEMPDATYEEYYGSAYTGGLIKYVYPSGYQSMRPRSCPWKLSIVVCLLFTWLSVFIVGHCSDQVDQSQYRNDEIDDDTLVIDIRWCGSRPLYLMWVASMLITGLAAAYCSVIGYIKVRDFAVANSRSQPPGVVSGKSDYYVRIEDGAAAIRRTTGSEASSSATTSSYRPTIYQADGTPQFWGAHIYRPTQAAVAITSR